MKQTDSYNLSNVEPSTEDAIITNVGQFKGLDLIPSHLQLTYIDISLATASFRESILQRKLADVLDNYEFIFCDCPPNLSLSTQNGLAASDYYIIPVLPEPLAALGLGLISNRIRQLNRAMGRNLTSMEIVFSKYDRRIQETEKTAAEIISTNTHEYIFNTKIPENSKIKSAVRDASPIIIYSPKSKGAQAYKELAKEFLSRSSNIQLL
jgi:chromosome partitioning protein